MLPGRTQAQADRARRRSIRPVSGSSAMSTLTTARAMSPLRSVSNPRPPAGESACPVRRPVHRSSSSANVCRSSVTSLTSSTYFFRVKISSPYARVTPVLYGAAGRTDHKR